MATAQKPAYLEASPLGNKEHWDETYSNEIENHALDSSNEGTIWFEESNVEDVMLEHLEGLEWSTLGDSDQHHGISVKENVSIVDIGTGNGHFLFSMRDAGWQGRMLGLDYSAASVKLARKIQDSRHSNTSLKPNEVQKPSEHRSMHDGDDSDVARRSLIDFETFDVLQDSPESLSQTAFDLAIDKGTFDAISLSPTAVDPQGRRGCEAYGERVATLVRPGGWLIVTSCNWTVEELRTWIETPNLLEFGEVIEFPVFEFGGVKGQAVSSVCFRRVVQSDDSP